MQIVENQNRDSVTHVLGTADKKIPTPQPLENCLGNRKAVWNRGEGVLVCLLARPAADLLEKDSGGIH